jgi:hypothetical protein
MSIPYQISPVVGIQLVDQELSQSAPATKFEYITVTFNSTANTDTDIVHTLNTLDVDWQVVGLSFTIAPATTPCIYRNIAGSARPWGTNYIILRCNVASVQATLLLTKRRQPSV